MVTTRPVTKGGKGKADPAYEQVPRKAWKQAADDQYAAETGQARPSTPLPATSGIMIGIKANDVP